MTEATRSAGHRVSPTPALLVGLVITLIAVVMNGWYMTRQLSTLRTLQSDLVDRNRRNSLQLLRIQGDLNALALAMRDMLDADQQYPLTAWSAQFERIRTDLDAAMHLEAELAIASRTVEQREYLQQSVTQFWDAVDRMFGSAQSSGGEEALTQVRLTLQPRQAALSAAVARQLVQNNEAEEATAARVQAIYAQVGRQVYLFVGATLTTILLTSLFLIRSNRRLFAELAALSDERRQLARQAIAARESTLLDMSRELHDDLGQVLTAIGSMVGRAARRSSHDTDVQNDLHEVQTIAQTTLDKVRTLSQTLHPSILEDGGLQSAVEWYVSTVKRQTGVDVSYERTGPSCHLESTIAIHVYRVLQEALNNVARHSGMSHAWVRLNVEPGALVLEVEDRGKGLAQSGRRQGLGLVAMRERAALIGGTLSLLEPPGGGTLVRLTLPLDAPTAVVLTGATA
jgi:signal transduction histidine kinase